MGAGRFLFMRSLSSRHGWKFRVVVDQLGQRLEREPAKVCIKCDDALRMAQQRPENREDGAAILSRHGVRQEVREHLL